MDKQQVSQSAVDSTSAVRNWLVILSPIILVAFCSLLARVMVLLLGSWAWVGTVPVYWIAMIWMILAVSGKQKALERFGKPHGSWLWIVAGLLIAFSALPLLLPNAELLRQLPLTLIWFVFGLINGPVEESYWRGFLFNEIQGWPLWAKATYSTVLFVAIHFLMLGTFSASLFNIPFLVILTVLTVVYVFMYIRTGSLRWLAISHTLTDWGNMNIFVFMNMIKPF